MTLRPRFSLVAALAVLALVVTACGGDDAGGLTIDNVRSRIALASTGNGAVYMDITNEGDVDDELASASVSDDVAGVVELHETVTAEDTEDMDMTEGDGTDMTESDGTDMTEGTDVTEGEGMEGMGGMQMRQVQSIAVPAGETIDLEPGGLHVMLLELASDLEEGDEFDVQLQFAEAGTVTVTATVSADV